MSPLSQSCIVSTKLTQHFFEIQEVNERDTEIMRIAQSIEELAVIFKQLAVLVIDQGTILDRIDYYQEYPNGYIGGTFTCNLPKCGTFRKKRKHFACCYLVIAIMLIVLVAKKVPKSSK